MRFWELDAGTLQHFVHDFFRAVIALLFPADAAAGQLAAGLPRAVLALRPEPQAGAHQPAWPNCAAGCRRTSAKFTTRLTGGNSPAARWPSSTRKPWCWWRRKSGRI